MKPNHHHLLHVKQCVLDYGPIHVFWTFAFERNNGLLASFHSSQRTIELEMMKRYIQQQLMLNQDHASLATVALEHAELVHQAAVAGSRSIPMQSYTDEPPQVLKSEYNQSWFVDPNDPYPYLHLVTAGAGPRARLVTIPTVASAAAAAGHGNGRSGHGITNSLIYSYSIPQPMSGILSRPCRNCAHVVDTISMMRTEDKASAVAFMPSNPTLWREFKQ